MLNKRYTEELSQEIGEKNPTALLDEILSHIIILVVLVGRIEDKKVQQKLNAVVLSFFAIFRKYYITFFSTEHKLRFYMTPNGELKKNILMPVSRLFSKTEDVKEKIRVLPKYKSIIRKLKRQ